MVAATEHGRPRSGLGREFGKLWAASAFSYLGDSVALVAAPLLAATLTRDPARVAGLVFAQRLPWLLFALLSGALVDRLDRRRTMMAVALCRAALIGCLGVAVLLGRATLPLLYAVFFLLSTGDTLFDIAAVTVLPAVVPPESLPRANARLAGVRTITSQFAGPPLSGFLFATALALPFLFGAGGLAAAAVLIVALRGTFRVARADNAGPANLRVEIMQGIGWLWRHRLLRTIALALALLDMTLLAQNAIMVLFVQERLGLGATGYGILLTTYGLGGVLGSLIAHRVITWLGPSRILRIAICIEAGTPAVIALSHTPYLVGAAFAIFGCHAIVWGALLTSLRQELTPAGLRGRVESAFEFIGAIGTAPGALLGGLLASGLGLTAPFWLGAIVGVLLIPLVWSTFSDATIAAAKKRSNAEHGSHDRENAQT
ncbi:MAG: MFS transporter [Thermomicrobiales bacterium]